MPTVNGYLYEHLFKGMINGFAHCQAVYNKDDKMIDWVYINVNAAFEKQTGLKDATGKTASVLIPNILEEDKELFERYELVAKGGVHQRFEYYVNALETWFDISVYSIERNTFTVIFENINKRKANEIEIALASEEILMAFVTSLEFRDAATEKHTIRVTELAVKFAERLGMRGEDLMNVRRGALLHDIGKIGIPDSILLKEGRLTTEEYEIMKKHSQFAYDVLFPIKYLRPAIDIPYCHHEEWDGGGYPSGLKGEQIPLAARMFSIIDVYDAMTSDRPYRKAISHADAIVHIKDRSGRNFDPALVDKFLEIIEEENE